MAGFVYPIECFSVLANFFVLVFLGFIVRVFSKLRFDDGLGVFSNDLLLNYIVLWFLLGL